jgi:hypothetical protein
MSVNNNISVRFERKVMLSQQPQKRLKRNNDGDDVVDFLFNQMTDYAASPEVEDELSLYLDQKIGATDVLSYWCINRHKLPKMSHLARKLLAIPATSTASERVFSTCGVILTDRRCRLSTTSLEMLLFLKYNMSESP